MERKEIDNISAEMLAAFLEGNAAPQESRYIIGSLSEDAGLRELLDISQSVDIELGKVQSEYDILPMTAMAASCAEGAYCCQECEKQILREFDVPFDEEQIMIDAVQNGWYTEDGTALHNVGHHMEKNGLVVTRKFRARLCDISDALSKGEKVIVAVDGGELLGNREQEMKEDLIVGQIPDHTVVVLHIDENAVTISDPNSINDQDTYPINVFADAWSDSMNYLVTAQKI